jgi:hypothetical protein
MPTMPSPLHDLLERIEADPEPISSLESSRRLFKALADWQAALVGEAVGSGASWEEVGAALGTTRQAAWARFRSVAEQTEGRSIPHRQEVKAMQESIKDQLRSLQAQLKVLDQKWREQQAQLRHQSRDLERQRAEDRKKLQHDIRAAETTLRAEIRKLREPPP